MPARNVPGICTRQNFSAFVPTRAGFSNAVVVCTRISHVVLFDTSSLILISAGFSAYWLIKGRILVLKGLRFLREGKSSHPMAAGPTSLLCAGSSPQPAFPFFFPGVLSRHDQSQCE